jgi:NADPH:quinone reductase-like Zn-dependent oxidoreductase
MRAIICTAYGPPEVLELVDVETPVPGDREILVRVHATAVTAGDYRVRGLNVPVGFRLITRLLMGIRRPRRGILGTVASGVVEAVGEDVVGFQPGDEVFASVGSSFGAYAEYMALPEDAAVAARPAGTTHEQAAAIPFGGLAALHFLRRAGLEPGQGILVYGASASVGLAAVQLAKHFGARVTAVCGTRNVERVRSLGADRVLDYTRDALPPEGEVYDVVLEVVGKTDFDLWRPALKPGGAFVMISAGLPGFLRMARENGFGDRRIIAGVAGENREDLEFLGRLVESGALRPVIDRTWPLEEIVEAHRYADGGHKTGSVVVTV